MNEVHMNEASQAIARETKQAIGYRKTDGYREACEHQEAFDHQAAYGDPKGARPCGRVQRTMTTSLGRHARSRHAAGAVVFFALLLGLLTAPACIWVEEDDFGFVRTYGACDFDDDCRNLSDLCIDIEFDGSLTPMCTQSCLVNTDCPGRGSCLSFDRTGEDALCYRRCIDDVDCDPGFICEEAVGDLQSDFVCLPGGGFSF